MPNDDEQARIESMRKHLERFPEDLTPEKIADLRRKFGEAFPTFEEWQTRMAADYRDTAARHHVDCVCAACERAGYEERQQHTRDSMSRDVNEYLDREAEHAAEEELDHREALANAVFDPKFWFTTQYGDADNESLTWEELVAWLVARPCDSEQSRATKLLAAFVMRRKA